jgi:hypothetical protein
VGENVSQSQLGKAWYDRRIGVRVRMLGQAGTTAYTFDTPTSYPAGTHRAPRDGEPRPRPETGGTSIAIARQAPETMFIALHEPIEGGKSRIDSFERIAQTDDAVAARVTSKNGGVNDRLMVRVGDKAGEPATLAGAGESFSFVGHAYLSVDGSVVNVRGDLRAMRLACGKATRLVVNGKTAKSKVENGFMVYTAD